MSLAKHLKKPDQPGALFQASSPAREPAVQQPPRTAREMMVRIEQQAMRQLQIEQPVLAEMAETLFADPGVGISPEDSELWLWLFTKAREINIDLHARLFYIRGGGARLVEHEKFGYIIQPIIDPEGKRGWPTREFYDQEKQCLNPFANEIMMLLRKLPHLKKQLSQTSLNI